MSGEGRCLIPHISETHSGIHIILTVFFRTAARKHLTVKSIIKLYYKSSPNTAIIIMTLGNKVRVAMDSVRHLRVVCA